MEMGIQTKLPHRTKALPRADEIIDNTPDAIDHEGKEDPEIQQDDQDFIHDHDDLFEDASDTESQYDELEEQQDSDIEAFPKESLPRYANSTDFTPHEVHQFPNEYKSSDPIRESLFSEERTPGFNHLFPFINGRDYKLARFFIESKVPKVRIDQFFRDGLLSTPCVDSPTSRVSFESAYMLNKQLSQMKADPPWYTGSVEFPLRPKSEFQYRSILACIQYLLKPRAFVDDMLWAPVKVFNNNQERIYSEMNTAEWWWEEQVCHNIF